MDLTDMGAPVVEHIVVRCTIGGSLEETFWGCEQIGPRYASSEEAAREGWKHFGHDDFNLARVQGDRLVWFGWMDEQHDMSGEDWAYIADLLGLLPPEAVFAKEGEKS